MSENLTLANQSAIMNKLHADAQTEIMIKLPLVTLIKVQGVCKEWDKLISNQEFKNIYLINQKNTQHLLFVMTKSDIGYQYYLISDDDTFPSEKVTLKPPLPLRPLTNIRLLNCVKGYQCFFGDLNKETKRFVMWDVVVPPKVKFFDIPLFTEIPLKKENKKIVVKYKNVVVGCGICPVTNDIKLVKLCFRDCLVKEKDSEAIKIIPGVDAVNLAVYTFGDGAGWRDKGTRIFASRAMESSKTSINGFIYFRTFDRIKERSNFFKAFDLKNENLVKEEVPIPESYTRNFIQSAEVNGSLGLLDYHDGLCDVWTKGEGDNKFTKMYTVKREKVSGFFGDGDILEFSHNGHAVVELRGWKDSKIGVYDHVSEQMTKIDVGINGKEGALFVRRYTSMI